MIRIATALASASLLASAAPAMAQMHAWGGGHAAGVHVHGGIPSGGHVGGDTGRGRVQGGPAGRLDMHGKAFGHHRHGYGAYGLWPYGGLGFGYGYPWYAEPDYDDEEEADASAPMPAPLPRYSYYRRHDPNACAEWTWSPARRQFTCTRRAS